MDVGGVPGVGGVDVVGAGRGRADQVGHGPQQHVVARPRPRLVEEQLVGLAEERVVEEVQRGPAAPGRDAEPAELPVEVVGAVHVARVAHVLVVLGVAGQRERVVPAHGVAHHLDQRAHVLVEELAGQPRLRVRVTHQVAGGGRVQAPLHAVVEPPRVERQEVRALAALDVDDLDVLAGLDLVRERGRGIHPQVEHGVGQRGRQLGLARRPGLRPPDLEHQVGRRVVRVHGHQPARGRHHRGDRPVRDEHGGLPAGDHSPNRPTARAADWVETRAPASAPITSAAEKKVAPGCGVGEPGAPSAAAAASARSTDASVSGAVPSGGVVLGAAARQHGQLAALAPLGVDDRELVPGAEFHRGDGAGMHPVTLQARVGRDQAGQHQPRARCVGLGGRRPPQTPPRAIRSGRPCGPAVAAGAGCAALASI